MDSIDWSQLQALRQAYLGAQGFLPDYWQNESLLEAYEQTLAQRIAWKWEAVLAVVRARLGAAAPQLPIPALLDWGCGTGMASRSLLASGLATPQKLYLYDRSARAVSYARRQLTRDFPQLLLENGLPGPHEEFALLVSHVLSELPEAARAELLALAQRASWVFWVEAGRPQESRLLSQLRSELARDKVILAPCPHQGPCGMLAADQGENWCHFFAPVPQFVFRSAAWRSYSQQLGIDLRSLPVSFLVAAAPTALPAALPSEAESVDGDSDMVRIVGRSRSHKAYSRWIGCHASGVLTGSYLKRRSREIYKNLQDPGLAMSVPRSELLSEKEDKDI